MNISGVGLITFDESKVYADPAKDEGSLSEQSNEVEDDDRNSRGAYEKW